MLSSIGREAGDARTKPMLVAGIGGGEASGQRRSAEISANGGIGQPGASVSIQFCSEDFAEQILGQRQFVGLERQAQAAQLAEGERI
ncbi:MAG TPA: hypothetical protein VGQ19_06890, partial [Burkholderiales bacterium]|nr:hypothetical protein [Burkholderiales bacterium]